MKVIILTNGSTSEIFQEKESLINFLNDRKIKGTDISQYKITFGELQVESEQDGLSLLNSEINQIKRDIKIQSLTDQKINLVENFNVLFNQLAPETKDKKIILSKLALIADKKELSKLISSNSNYFLYQVSSEVKWFKLLLSIYNFRKINNSFIKEFVNKDGTSSFCNCTTPQNIISSFNEAKSSK